jgi:hypothetical protein
MLDERRDVISGQLTVCTMHLAKGLEFRAVMVIDRGCAGFLRRPLLGDWVNNPILGGTGFLRLLRLGEGT